MADTDRQMQTIEFTWGAAEHAKARWVAARPQLVWPGAAFGLVAAAAMTQAAWSVAGVSLFFAVLPTATIPRHARLDRERHKYLREPIRWTWSPDEVSVNTAAVQTNLQAGGIVKVARSSGFVILTYTPGSRAIVPERAFADRSQLESFVASAEPCVSLVE